ncbi:MAG: hypothetical protein JXB38_09905 [Anaerolineales bacterium]|nr:hypothetical protein [Anaerolineales bacterium]
MPIHPNVMIVALGIFIVTMTFLGFSYLRRRELETWEYIAWGILVIIVPVLGPFIVIASRPGRTRKQFVGEKKVEKTKNYFKVRG